MKPGNLESADSGWSCGIDQELNSQQLLAGFVVPTPAEYF